MDNNEMKLVTRQETFNDLAVRELAKGRSACLCRIQFGRCSKSECASCEIHRQYETCYNALSDYDKQRLATYVNEQWQKDSLWPDKWRSSSQYVRRQVLWFLGVTFAVVLFTLLTIGFVYIVAEWPCDAPQNYDYMIKASLRLGQSNVEDFNKDGKVNCIDYSCSFKREWDALYPDRKGECQIVRNLNNATGMHHLFIMVNGIEVEPWTSDINRYEMKYNWPGSVYKRSCNIYGETKLWMRQSGLKN